MNGYNVYFAGNRLNPLPLNENEINEIKKQKVIYKQTIEGDNKILHKIPVNGLKIVKCIIL